MPSYAFEMLRVCSLDHCCTCLCLFHQLQPIDYYDFVLRFFFDFERNLVCGPCKIIPTFGKSIDLKLQFHVKFFTWKFVHFGYFGSNHCILLLSSPNVCSMDAVVQHTNEHTHAHKPTRPLCLCVLVWEMASKPG